MRGPVGPWVSENGASTAARQNSRPVAASRARSVSGPSGLSNTRTRPRATTGEERPSPAGTCQTRAGSAGRRGRDRLPPGRGRRWRVRASGASRRRGRRGRRGRGRWSGGRPRPAGTRARKRIRGVHGGVGPGQVDGSSEARKASRRGWVRRGCQATTRSARGGSRRGRRTTPDAERGERFGDESDAAVAGHQGEQGVSAVGGLDDAGRKPARAQVSATRRGRRPDRCFRRWRGTSRRRARGEQGCVGGRRGGRGAGRRRTHRRHVLVGEPGGVGFGGEADEAHVESTLGQGEGLLSGGLVEEVHGGLGARRRKRSRKGGTSEWKRPQT